MGPYKSVLDIPSLILRPRDECFHSHLTSEVKYATDGPQF